MRTCLKPNGVNSKSGQRNWPGTRGKLLWHDTACPAQHGLALRFYSTSNCRSIALRARSLRSLPRTCMTASVRPWPGRTAPSSSRVQSSWFLMMTVAAPWHSGLRQTYRRTSDTTRLVRPSWDRYRARCRPSASPSDGECAQHRQQDRQCQQDTVPEVIVLRDTDALHRQHMEPQQGARTSLKQSKVAGQSCQFTAPSQSLK